MKTRAFSVLSLLLLAYLAAGCQMFGRRTNPVTTADLDKDPVALDFRTIGKPHLVKDGWYHYTFWFTPLARFEPMPTGEALNGLSCISDNDASILARHLDVDLSKRSKLSWRWRVQELVPGKHADRTVSVDDSPARFFIVMEDLKRKKLMFELYWSTSDVRGTNKTIGGFFHHAVRGREDKIGGWFEDSVNLVAIAAQARKDFKPVRLTVLGVFCDNDDGRGRSVAQFDQVRLLDQ
jgi:hypothetical protein